MAFLCGSAGEWPDVGNGEAPCCESSAMRGPEDCTCWVPVYDQEQAPPRTGHVPGSRRTMCGDCAYRPHSPERAGDPTVAGDADTLAELVATGTPFFCHTGMRRPRVWRHPSGAEIAGDPADYQPLIVDGVPYQANGLPGVLCGGWSALRAAALERGQA